jgi:hypothetical protein
MDTELLVEQKSGGQRLIEQLVRDGFPVSAAFWVRTSEGGLWHLEIASPAVDEETPVGALRKVFAAMDELPTTWVTPADVTLISEQNPTARAVIELRDAFPAPLPSFYQGRQLGNLAIKGAYIYPNIEAPRVSFTVTYVRDGKTNCWVATVKRRRLYRDIRVKGAVSYSTASWEGENEADQKFASVSVLVEIDPRFDRPEYLESLELRQLTAEQARTMADELFKSHHPDAVIEHDRGGDE